MPIDILIAGGGPVGVALAIFATKMGLSIRIVEKTDGLHKEGRADMINPRTIECFQQVSPDLSNTILESALKYAGTCNYKNGQLTARNVPIMHHCKYNHMTYIPQHRMEAIIQSHLKSMNVDIERSKELVHFDVIEDDVAPIRAIVKHVHTGKEEIISASYMVGCEGGKSFTRRKLGIPLIGDSAEISYYVMDNSYKKLDVPSKDVMSLLQSDLGTLLIIPTGKDHYRTAVRVREEPPGHQTLVLEEVLAFAKKLAAPFEIEFDVIYWSSYFSVKELVAEEYSYNNCVFLAGDACHMHGPAGGLGVNTGFGDAYDLAWKLYLAKHGIVDRTFLELYNKERHDIAEKVIHISGMMMRLYSQVSDKNNSPSGQNSSFQKELSYVARRNNDFITGLGTEYSPSQLSVRDSSKTLSFSEPFNILSGRRFPDAKVVLPSSTLGDAKFLYDYWGYTPTFRIIIFPGDLSVTSSTFSSLLEYLKSPAAFPQKYFSPTSIPLFETLIILCDQETALLPDSLKGFVLSDASKEEGLYSILGIDSMQGAIFVVRPDDIIGCTIPMSEFNDLEIYFEGFLIPTETKSNLWTGL